MTDYQSLFNLTAASFDVLNLPSLTPSLPLVLDGSSTVTSARVDLKTQVQSVLPVASGGTASSAALTNGKLMTSAGGAIVEGTSSTTPTFTTVTTGGSVMDTNGIVNLSSPSLGFQNYGGIAQVLGVGGVQLQTGGAATVTADSPVVVTNATESTSTTTGCLRLSGGAGVAKNVFVGGDATVVGLTASLPVKTDAAKKLVSGQILLTSEVSGVLPVASGGTASSTALTNGKLMASVGGAIVEGTSSTTPSFTGLTLSGPLTTEVTPTQVLTITGGEVRQCAASKTSLVDTIAVRGAGANCVFGSVTLAASANQIFINPGATSTLITVPNPAASRTVTLPDGGANSSIVLTEGAQTINGTKTFSGSISASNLSGTNTGDVTLAAVGAVPNANGASLAGQVLTLQPASGTQPGVITAGAQTIGGAKTFSGAISASNLSGTNTGDVTLAAVGAVPNANGASLAGQVLTLQPASATLPGVVTAGAQTIGGAKTFNDSITASGTTNVCARGWRTQYSIGDNASAVQNIANNVNTVLTWSNRSAVGITYNAGQFTVVNSGIYMVSCSISWGAFVPPIYLWVFKNGAGFQHGATQLSNATFNLSTSALISCAANDVLTFVVNQQSGAAQNVTPQVYGISLVSAL